MILDAMLVITLVVVCFTCGVLVSKEFKPTQPTKEVEEVDSELDTVDKMTLKEKIALRQKELDREEGLENIMRYDGTSQEEIG